jgi:Pyridoxal-dependent decarboxylase conserved domain
LPNVEPGFMRKLLPEEAPEESEDWRDVMKDMDRAIMPGVSKQSLC